MNSYLQLQIVNQEKICQLNLNTLSAIKKVMN